jgi:hypothetical protein
MTAFDTLTAYFGDLHSHCGLSYGHGSIEDAYKNAKSQLDFVSITAHAHWPDMPRGAGHLADVRKYHLDGFERAAEHWPILKAANEANNEDGNFISFLSFEWHSMRYGDHNVYFKGAEGEIIRSPDLESLRQRLRDLREQGSDSFLIPHHIGYRNGYRGIDWDSFTSEFSPVVEIFSMHGSSEAVDAPYPYFHTMGPRDSKSTMHHGLKQEHIFGVIGSTDQHSAHPGSYGHGRLGVWARELTRQGIWEAIEARRTYALTGDNIELKLSVNGHPMGSVLPHTSDRTIEAEARGGSEIDYIEILQSNQAIHRWSAHQAQPYNPAHPVKVQLELGWGEIDHEVDWEVELTVNGGRLLGVEPRLRGRDIVSPQEKEASSYAFSSWARPDDSSVSLSTRTWQNPSVVSPSTQGLCLEVMGDGATSLLGRIKERAIEVKLADLLNGSCVEYLDGFLSPAFCFHRAVPTNLFSCSTVFVETVDHDMASWYTARVRQKNGQWAWSSPIWVRGSSST